MRALKLIEVEIVHPLLAADQAIRAGQHLLGGPIGQELLRVEILGESGDECVVRKGGARRLVDHLHQVVECL